MFGKARGEYSRIAEDGNVDPIAFVGTRSQSSKWRTCPTRRAGALVIGFVTLIFISSTILVLSVVELPTILRKMHYEVYGDACCGGLGGWRDFEDTSSALAGPELDERQTLPELFFSSECAEAWVAEGVLCDQMKKGYISREMREALKLSTVHTWVNGSDERLQEWKQILSDQQSYSPAIRNRPGDLARHFRYICQNLTGFTGTN